MRTLSPSLRRQLETSVLTARRAAEAASRAAIERLGVFADRRPEHLDAAEAALRNGLRAKWRQFGNDRDLLVAECAYEQWHRLLFARFLAENDLLLHPQFRAPVTLAECEELAADLGEPDGVVRRGALRRGDPARDLPARRSVRPATLRAGRTLRTGADPRRPAGRHLRRGRCPRLGVSVLAEGQEGRGQLLGAQDRRRGPRPGDAAVHRELHGPVPTRELPRRVVGSPPSGQSARKGFEYLRFDDDGKPAAGAFEGWPDRVAEVTVMDPCCGSGHFLVEAFSMLWQMRAEEEGLASLDAQDLVLRDNLFGLELDPRCVQIAMFAVALQAWKSGGGWRDYPCRMLSALGSRSRHRRRMEDAR